MIYIIVQVLGYIFFFFFLFFQFKICSRYQIILFLLILYELKSKDFGDNLLHHGKINFSVLIALLFLDNIAILLLVFIYKIIKKKKCIFVKILMVLTFLLFYLIYYKIKDKYYCKDWDKGLNNSYINNDITKYPCSINIPKRRCLIDITI